MLVETVGAIVGPLLACFLTLVAITLAATQIFMESVLKVLYKTYIAFLFIVKWLLDLLSINNPLKAKEN